MHPHARVVAGLLLGLVTAMFIACSDSSKQTFVPSTSTATAATSSGTGGPLPGAVASVTSVRVVGAPLVTGDVPVAFRLVDANAAPATITVSYSTDGGGTWSLASEAPGSSGRVGLQTGGGLGIEHIFMWASATDIPSFETDVRLEVELVTGAGAASRPFAVDNQPLNQGAQPSRMPWLQSVTKHKAIVLWRTTASTDSVIEFGLTPNLGQTLGDPGASTRDHVVKLSGLLKGTDYFYRVVSSGQPTTTRKNFTTAPSSSSADFTFLAIGDSGALTPEQFALGALMAQEDADLIIHLGDIVYPDGGQGNVVPEYNARFFEPYKDLLDEVCIFPAPGNHDRHDFFGPYRETFMTPENGLPLVGELYYSFEWGDAKFVMLETTTLFRIPIGPHFTWLRNELTSNTKKWLIVYMHHTLYSAGSHGDDAVLISTLGPIFENSGVDLVLSGHDHNYERTRSMKQFNTSPGYLGLTYLISGGGGTGLRPVTPNANTAFAVSAHHYLKLRVQGDTMYVEAIGLGGQVIDSFAVINQ